MAKSFENDPIKNMPLDDLGFSDEYDLSSFNDINISADDSLESILEKFATVSTLEKKENPIVEESIEESSDADLPVKTEIQSKPIQNKEIAPVKEKKPASLKKKKELMSWTKFKEAVSYTFADVWTMVRYEFIADPESFFRKLGFTFMEFFNKFMYWVARVSRYFLLPISLGIVIAVILFMSTHTLAIKVTMSDRIIGYVNNTEEYDAAVIKAEEILSEQIGEESKIESVPTYEIAMVRKDLVLDATELENKVTQVSGETVGKNYGLFVDGTLIGTNTKESAIEEMLENIKASYQTNADNEVAIFVQNVEIIEGSYADSFAVSIAEMRSRLLSSSSIEIYIWEEEDTLDSVLAKHNMTRDTFMQLNPDVDLVFNPGDSINVVVVKPLVSVQVQRTIVYDKAIPHETDISYDPNVWANKKTVVTEGVDGVSEITATVLLIDGVEQGREIISEVVTREPITEVVIEGTKEIVSSGKYMWPIDHWFVITDRYLEDRGDRNHGALDIAAPEGISVFACDAGTVIEANWFGTYGYQVLILHDDGIYTRYAHCSALLVSAGDQVYQGQEIALLGNTGYSTGPHLHLEFIVDGEKTDPELFVDIPGE